MTVYEYLKLFQPLSVEGKVLYASGSEMRRWFERGSVEIDGEKALPTDWVWPNTSLVLHPKGKHRTTLQ